MLSEKYGDSAFDITYVDIDSPVIINHFDAFQDITNTGLPLPYVSVNGRRFCYGINDYEEVFTLLEKEWFK